jgi:hypothetical protein
MSNLNSPIEGPGRRKEILTGILTLGAGGAIASQACEGFSAVKTATEVGRYTVTLAKGYNRLSYAHMVVEVATDAAATSAKAVVAVLRNVNASGKSADFQLTIPPLAAGAGVDAEAQDSAILRIVMVANRGAL